ncbi:MAG: hypothetical protein ACXADW_20430 [Candidatus Hodarchaeales archaeon]|jgi:hypothetical protein
MDLSKPIKISVSILSGIGMIFGAAYFIDERYQKRAEARTTMARIEKESVKTFKQQQEYTDTQQQKIELEILDILKDDIKDIERRLEKDPTSIYLKNQFERLKNKIKRLEDKLYN